MKRPLLCGAEWRIMIKIVLDSASDCDITGKQNHCFIPLTVTIGGKDYLDGVNLDKKTFYELLISGEEFPKTSQPAPQTFVELFEAAREQGDELIYFALSSALSGTYQSAMIAKEMVEYDGIYLVDTCSVSYGIGIIAEQAEKLRDSGASAEEIVSAAEELKRKIRIIAAVDTLEYLYRGGRLSRGAAAVGSVAGIKPTITVSQEGTVSILGKNLGKGRAMQHMMKILAGVQRDERYPVDTLFTYGEENCAELEEKLKGEGCQLGTRLQIGSAIGAHVGPGAYGVLFVAQ